MGSFRESGLKSSPPFEKGRTGGISEPKFQKAKVIPLFIFHEESAKLSAQRRVPWPKKLLLPPRRE
jgi:hypothetical protein